MPRLKENDQTFNGTWTRAQINGISLSVGYGVDGPIADSAEFDLVQVIATYTAPAAHVSQSRLSMGLGRGL